MFGSKMIKERKNANENYFLMFDCLINDQIRKQIKIKVITHKFTYF